MLPRGEGTSRDYHDWSKEVRHVNRLVQASVKTLANEFGACRVAFAGCTKEPFLVADDEHRVNEQTMPDGVHPNGEGWRRLYGECIRPELEKLSHPCTDAYKSYD